MNAEKTEPPELSIALVGICGVHDIRRCLDSLLLQEGVPTPEIVLAYDPGLRAVDELQADFPTVRFVVNQQETSPLQLASRAVRETTGKYVLLTEDHCIAAPGWAKAMWQELKSEACGAVGGTIDIRDSANRTDWAFFFVDFFRYARPVNVQVSPTLTVCNVGYRREDLDRLNVSWAPLFLETTVHDSLRDDVGPLHLCSKANLTMQRHVTLPSAVKERYVFGRLFGASRMKFTKPMDKWKFRFGAPLLPALLMRRMSEKALSNSELRGHFIKSIGPLSLMIMAWSVGEFMGYWTETHPEDLSVAQEIDRK